MFTACPGIQACPRSQVGKTFSKQLASSALVWRHIDRAARLHLLGHVEVIVGGRAVDGCEESQYKTVIRRRRVSSYASGHRRWHRSHGGHGHPCQRPSCPCRYTVWSANLRIDTACPGQGSRKIPHVRAAAPLAVAVTSLTVVIPLTIIVPVAVTTFVQFAVTALIFARRVVAGAAARGGRPAARGGSTKTAVAVATRVEAPRRRRRGAGPLPPCQQKRRAIPT